MKVARTLALAIMAMSASPALADAPEQLYEAAPAKGRIAIEYDGQFGSAPPDSRDHSIEAMVGITDRVALDFEIEGEAENGTFRAEEFAVGLAANLTESDAKVGVTLFAQIGIDREGQFPHAQARLIVGSESERWGWNSNLILRRDAEDKSLDLAYGLQANRRVADNLNLGFEASGQLTRISGPAGLDMAHFAGPAAKLELGEDDAFGAELGLSWLWRINGGANHRRTVRLELGLRF